MNEYYKAIMWTISTIIVVLTVTKYITIEMGIFLFIANIFYLMINKEGDKL